MRPGALFCAEPMLTAERFREVHGVPLITPLKNLVLPAHLLCFYSLCLTPSHVLGVSSHSIKASGAAQAEVSKFKAQLWQV